MHLIKKGVCGVGVRMLYNLGEGEDIDILYTVYSSYSELLPPLDGGLESWILPPTNH